MNDLTLNIVLIYLVAINVVTFVVYGIDKYKAVRSKWRIPENTLIGLAVVGGSVGAWMGMNGHEVLAPQDTPREVPFWHSHHPHCPSRPRLVVDATLI